MGQLNSLQHYIPQFYLRNFSLDNKSIVVYDKIQEKVYKSPINKVASERYFYSLPENTFDENGEKVDSLFIENDYFANNIEPSFSILIRTILENKEKWIKDHGYQALNVNDKYNFAKFIAIQRFRVPSYREELITTRKDIMDGIFDLFTEGLSLENPDLDIDLSPSDKGFLKDSLTPNIKLDHANLGFRSESLIDTYAQLLAHNYWEFSFIPENDLYTSDRPIAYRIHSREENLTLLCGGLANYSSEVTFPISKDILLTIWDKNYFGQKKRQDCKFSTLPNIRKVINNYTRLLFAKRQIFCLKKEFLSSE